MGSNPELSSGAILVIEPHYCHGTREFAYASQDPKEELLLGPAYAIPKVCHFPGSGSTMNFHHAGYGEGRNGTRRLPGDNQQNLKSKKPLPEVTNFLLCSSHISKVLELHEAFAGQVLSNLKALESEKFCQEKLGLNQKVLKVVVDRRRQESVQSIAVPDLRWGSFPWRSSTTGAAPYPLDILSELQVDA